MSEKRAVITGASGAIGSALCASLVASGHRLVLLDRKLDASQALAARLERVAPRCIEATLAVDLSDPADIRRVTDDLVARFPVIDALFNNAGVLTETLQFSKAGRELHFEVNALAPLQMIDALRPALRRSASAVVVNTSAGIALGEKELVLADLVRPKSFSKLFGPYTKSKAALNVISAALASELAADRILVRAADPGPTKSALTKGAGTPLWMRVFYAFLPTPERSARNISDAALSPKWALRSGIFLSGGKVKPLPPKLADPSFQADFLARCRRLVAEST